MRGEELLKLASSGPVLSDGAMGTMLQALGLEAGSCPEIWNVERADDVRSVHQAYVCAGSKMIGTNTFGGSRIKLAAYGLADRVSELNRAGAALAREASGNDVSVAASIGPLGKLLEPLGEVSYEEAVTLFAEQAAALAEGGADVILAESFADLNEISAALEGALPTGLPCFCTMTFDRGGRTMMGVDPVTAAEQLRALGAAGVGANCGLGPSETLGVVRQIRDAVSILVIAQPNAGLPKVVQGVTVYDCSPAEMAAFASEAAEAGVDIIGGCCGTGPEHVAAMAAALNGKR